jgi:hypothetical protein
MVTNVTNTLPTTPADPASPTGNGDVVAMTPDTLLSFFLHGLAQRGRDCHHPGDAKREGQSQRSEHAHRPAVARGPTTGNRGPHLELDRRIQQDGGVHDSEHRTVSAVPATETGRAE